MEVSATTANTTNASERTDGFNGLTADDFFKLLIAQLQSQDPTEPVGNEELLNQIATIRSVQSNVEISDVLRDLSATLTSQQSIDGQRLSVGASYIGRSVTLENAQTGLVDRAFLRDGQVFLVVGGVEAPLDSVTSVNTPESLVGQLVQARLADSSQEPVLAVVANAFEQDGQQFVTLAAPDSQGQLQELGEIRFEQITAVHSYDSIVGKRVAGVTDAGRLVSGLAIAAQIGGRPAFRINDEVIRATHIVSIES